MQSIEETDAASPSRVPRSSRRRSRLWSALALLVLLLLLALLPPLINLGRYQRRVATSISLSLGRPVHLDHLALNLLPLPSFTLTNLVVDENPAFGAEPIIRANSVRATLRVNSLWRRRVEFSRISFTDPSVNLVLGSNGRWNLDDVLLQASHVPAAPTAQRHAGSAPRFPYIEATGARVNLKIGLEKTPFSLTEADFALWLPEPQQWRMRLRARPMRTDTSASDTGRLEIEAALNRAPSLALVPASIELGWRNAPLGEASRLLLGRDSGLRGGLDLSAKAAGTFSDSTLEWHIGLAGLHRSDFVPASAVDIQADCSAHAKYTTHAIDHLRCSWPVPESDGAIVALTGSLPNLLDLHTADLQMGTGHLPAGTLLTWLRAGSAHLPADLTVEGSLAASLSYAGTGTQTWSGGAVLRDLALTSPRLGEAPVLLGPVDLAVDPAPSFRLEPLALPLGGAEPALLQASADEHGYTLHLTGSALPERLLALGRVLPQLGEGLSAVVPRTGESAEPTAVSGDLQDTASRTVHLDLTARRSWGSAQVWTDNLARTPSGPAHPGRR